MISKAQRIANLLRIVSGSDKRIRPTSALIVAADSSSRMGETGGVTKQHLELLGIPVVVRSLLAFEQCELISETVVVARADELAIYDEYKIKYGLTKLKNVVPGGETRQASVLQGFEAISPKSDFVAIHDGARCLVTPEIKIGRAHV